VSDCPRFGKLFGGCKFGPRYDLGAAGGLDGDYRGPAGGVALILEASKPKTYLRDVCERCGKVIER
jgi:hypothetical protein